MDRVSHFILFLIGEKGMRETIEVAFLYGYDHSNT
jgi:hypothetical protein